MPRRSASRRPRPFPAGSIPEPFPPPGKSVALAIFSLQSGRDMGTCFAALLDTLVGPGDTFATCFFRKGWVDCEETSCRGCLLCVRLQPGSEPHRLQRQEERREER